MSAKDVFDHTERSWDDAVDYADTLRNRQAVYATVLVVVAGLGTFQVSPFISDGDVFAVPFTWARWLIASLLLIALILMVVGAVVLYFSQGLTEEEKGIREDYATEYPDMPPLKRASDAFRLSPDEEAALVEAQDGGDDADWLIRVKKLQMALRTLEAANRRVSNKIQNSAVWIGAGVLAVVVAVGVYSISVNTRSEVDDHSHSPNQKSPAVRLSEGIEGCGQECKPACCCCSGEVGSEHSKRGQSPIECGG